MPARGVHFGDAWNWFDFVICVCSVVEIFVESMLRSVKALRILRLVRLARLVRAVRHWNSLREVLLMIEVALDAVWPSLLLLLLFLFIMTLRRRAPEPRDPPAAALRQARAVRAPVLAAEAPAQDPRQESPLQVRPGPGELGLRRPRRQAVHRSDVLGQKAERTGPIGGAPAEDPPNRVILNPAPLPWN